MVNAGPSPNDWDVGFTAPSIEVLCKSTGFAAKVRSNEVRPVHMMVVLLCGEAFNSDTLEFSDMVESPTTFSSVIEDLGLDPRALAQELIRQYSVAQPATRIPSSGSVNDLLSFSKAKESSMARPNQFPASQNDDLTSDANTTPFKSDGLLAAIKRAQEHTEELGDPFVTPYHLLLAIVDDQEVQERLTYQGVDSSSFLKALRDRNRPSRSIAVDRLPFLSKYATNMVMLAREGKLNKIVGRDEEIRRVIEILCRCTKNSAVLIGEPGVGKTAITEGLAHRIAFGQVPRDLKGTLYSLDLGALFAGAGKGEYEARVKGIIEDVAASEQSQNPAILFIDELHLIAVGKLQGEHNSGMDAANILKPALARGGFRCIGATNFAEYREYIEKDGALERRFAPVIVSEPTTEEAITILRGIRERYEEHHRVWIMDQALVAAVTLGQRYLTTRRLPDSAIDLLDEACASARVAQDMKPEAIDTVEQDLGHVEAHIKILEHHRGDIKALDEAKNTERDLKAKKRSLILQQEAIKGWWKKISVQRDAIQNKKQELAVSDTLIISELEADLKELRDGLVKLEHEGPPVEDAGDGKYSHSVSGTSSDIITCENIATIVEKATKIPVQRLLSTDKGRLLNLERALRQQVMGQPEAIKAVSRAIYVSRTKLGHTDRPIACLLFTGPSGTGKTLLCKVLAQELFGQATSMIRIDGSKYSQSDSIYQLVGSSPGYVGYQEGGELTEYVRRTPYSIVLLDEIDKTCQEFLNLFLQVLDEGRLTDGQGRQVDFRNCIVIMTSRDTHGFPIEFLNRIEDIVIFRTISLAAMLQLLNKQLQDLQDRPGIKGLRLDLDADAKKWLAETAIAKGYGARPLARMIQRDILNPLSYRLLEKQIREEETVLIRLNKSKDGLDVKPNHKLQQGFVHGFEQIF